MRAKPGKKFLCLVFALGVLVVPAARANDVFVDCDSPPASLPPGTYPTIEAALSVLPLTGFHTITVTGTCVEHVIIHGRDNIDLRAPEGQTATISRPPDPDMGNAPTMRIDGARGITLRRLVIRDGGAAGLIISRGSEATLIDLTFENNTQQGLSVQFGSLVSFSGAIVARQNGGNGIVASFSTLNFGGNGSLLAENNGNNGVLVNNGALTFNAPSVEVTSRNNANAGFNIGHRGHLIMGRDNGTMPVRISGNGGPGIGGPGNGSVIIINGDTIIENNAAGIGTANSRLILFAANTQNIVRNNTASAINVGGGAAVVLSGNNLLQNNGAGVQAGNQSQVAVNAANTPGGPVGLVIEGSASLGMNIVQDSHVVFNPGPHRIRNNAFGPAPSSPEFQGGVRLARATATIGGNVEITGNNGFGLRATAGATALINGNVQISNNLGPGISAELGVNLQIGFNQTPVPPPVLISGNSAEGIRLTAMSGAFLYQAPTMSGNGGGNIACDGSSWLFGDTSGISGIKCSNSDTTGKKK